MIYIFRLQQFVFFYLFYDAVDQLLCKFLKCYRNNLLLIACLLGILILSLIKLALNIEFNSKFYSLDLHFSLSSVCRFVRATSP